MSMILYSDDRVVVCVKPAGILSVDEPGGMPELIRRALRDDKAVVKSVHRLDRAVGGVMVYARTKRAAADLSHEIECGAFEKEYRAVVHGAVPDEHGVMRDYLVRDSGRRMTMTAEKGAPGAKPALLAYRRLAAAEGLTLLSVRLHTGRTHQIRCQLAARSLPIVGDRKYGVVDEAAEIALWSCRIAFTHPRTGERMEFFQLPPAVWPWSLFN